MYHYGRDEYDSETIDFYTSQFNRVTKFYLVGLVIITLIFGILEHFSITVPVPLSMLTFESMPTLWSVGFVAVASTGYFIYLIFLMVDRNEVVDKSTRYIVAGVISIVSLICSVILFNSHPVDFDVVHFFSNFFLLG